MVITYDLHIHTGLSPCSEEEMTPNNIVNMALISELDVIAITDHNTCENIEAVLEVAKSTDLVVIPGIEVETKEEIHMICLFPSCECAYNMQCEVYEHLPQMKNRKSIFGEQILYDSEDERIGTVERLLSFATDITLDELFELCERFQGVCIPAHIDRPSYSIISNLGMLPDNLKFETLEVSRHSDVKIYRKKYSTYRVIQSSDAHELGHIGMCLETLEVDERSIMGVINKLKSQKQ